MWKRPSRRAKPSADPADERYMITVQDFLDAAKDDLGLEVLSGADHLGRSVREAMTNRPGLALAGFFQYFANKRIQVMGLAEISYLRSLPPEERALRLEQFFAQRFPCLVLSRGRRSLRGMKEVAERFHVPVLRSSLITGQLINRATVVLENLTLPFTRCHGTMLEIMGVGVLIEGRPGIGKSEIALALVERGHSLVSDDVVVIQRNGDGKLIGSAPDVTRFHMEIRGLGIVHVSSLFGITSIRREKSLELVVRLVDPDPGTRLDRTGLDSETRSILDVDTPTVTLQVAPGRDIANVIEVAAMNQKLKNLGHDAAKELNDRIIAKLTRHR